MCWAFKELRAVTKKGKDESKDFGNRKDFWGIRLPSVTPKKLLINSWNTSTTRIVYKFENKNWEEKEASFKLSEQKKLEVLKASPVTEVFAQNKRRKRRLLALAKPFLLLLSRTYKLFEFVQNQEVTAVLKTRIVYKFER